MGTATGIKKQEDEKVGSGNNNNIGSTAKRIRAGFISNQDAALLHLPPLPKRPSSIATTLIPPLTSCSPRCLARKSRENRNGVARMRSHYTLVSLKGQHISSVFRLRSRVAPVVTQSQHSLFTNSIEVFCTFYTQRMTHAAPQF